jgi:hypothetical protein
MGAIASDAVFSDDVFTATELNRRGGAILDRARHHPVTISRNNEQFALLRREQAACLVGTVTKIVRSVAVLSEAHAAIGGAQPSGPFHWLQLYEKDDLQRLFGEILLATRKAASNECDWDEVETLIHEWRESAIVAQSGVLDTAICEPSEELPLESPEEVLGTAALDEAKAECLMEKTEET